MRNYAESLFYFIFHFIFQDTTAGTLIGFVRNVIIRPRAHWTVNPHAAAKRRNE